MSRHTQFRGRTDASAFNHGPVSLHVYGHTHTLASGYLTANRSIRQTEGEKAGMWKEPQHDRAQQEQALTQPISVRTPRVALPRCVAPEHPRNPYTLALFPAAPHAQVHTLQAWFVYLRVHLQIAGLTDHTPLLSLLTFAILPCVTAYLCRRTERESDKSRTVEYVSVYVAGTDEQLKTCQPDIFQMHEAQSRSRRVEPMQCIKSDIGWWWWWGSYYAEKNYY